jgi:hypothetical protein
MGAVLALSLPVLAAIWSLPGFVTQDGPAHVYNAWIVSRSFDPASPYGGWFQVRWQPLPNWVGHLALAGLFRMVSPPTAERIMMSASSLGLAASLAWLRLRVRGDRQWPGPILLAVLVSLNFPWLLGFTSFLLGTCLFAITLGVWWPYREGPGAARSLALMALLVLGYFCHLVSLGLTVVAMSLLALVAPMEASEGGGVRRRLRRLSRTAVCFLPLVFLGFLYLRMTHQGGSLHPSWPTMRRVDSLAEWVARLGWADPISLARKDSLPFSGANHRLFMVFSPALWLLAWGACVAVGRLRSPDDAGEGRGIERAWTLLGLLFVVGGIVGPDSLGPGHGEYLPQRPFLLGLAALVPAFEVPLTRWSGRMAVACLAVAVSLQSAIVVDYARHSDRGAGQIVRAGDLVGEGHRIATLLVGIRSRFRANPLLHADCWLGVETGNILWSNYETRYYYFPVQLKPGNGGPDSRTLERIAMETDPAPSPGSVALWKQVLDEHAEAIDRVLVWRGHPLLDAITEQRFALEAERGDVRVYAPRGPR